MKLSSLYLSLKTDLAAELIQPCNHCQLSLAQTSSDGFSENLGFDANSWVKKSVSKRIPAKPHDACMDEFQQFQFEVAFVDPCMGQVVCSNKTRLRHVCIAPISSQKKKTSLPRVFIKLDQPRVCRAMADPMVPGDPPKRSLPTCFSQLSRDWMPSDHPPGKNCQEPTFLLLGPPFLLPIEVTKCCHLRYLETLHSKKRSWNLRLQYTIYNDDGCLPFSFEELLGLLLSQWRQSPSTIWCTVGVTWYPSQDASVAGFCNSDPAQPWLEDLSDIKCS